MNTFKKMFTDALATAWSHPSLWLLSLFTFIFTSKNILMIIKNGFDKTTQISATWITLRDIWANWSQLSTNFSHNINTNFTAVLFSLVNSAFIFIILLILFSLAIFCEIIIINYLLKIYRQETTTYSVIIRNSLNKFWPAMAINLFVFLVCQFLIWLAGSLVILYSVYYPTSTLAFVASIVGSVAIVIIYFIWPLLSLLALFFLLEKNLSIFKASQQALMIIKHYWLTFLQTTCLIFLAEFMTTALGLIIITFFLKPLYNLTTIMQDWPIMSAFNVFIYALLLLLLAVLMAGAGLFNTMIYGLWLKIYQRSTTTGKNNSLIKIF